MTLVSQTVRHPESPAGQEERKPRPARARTGVTRKLLWAIVDQAAVSATGFFSFVLVGRFAGPEELGLYALGLSLIVLVVGAQDSLISSAYAIYANRMAEADRRRYAGGTLLQTLLLVLPAACGLLAAAACGWLGLGPAWLPNWSAALALLVPLALWRQFGRKMAFAHHQPERTATIDGLVLLIQLSALAWLGFAGRLNAVAAFAAVAAAYLAATLVWWRLSRREYDLHGADWAGDLRRNWRLGKWVLAGRMVSLTQTYVIHWLLGLFSTRAVGVFAACLNIVSISNLLLFAAGNVLEPRMARAYHEGGVAQVQRIARLVMLGMAAVMTLFAAAVLLAGDWAMSVLYAGEDFVGHAHALTVLAAAMFIDAAALGASQALRVLERPQVNFRANLAGLACTLIVGCCAMPAAPVLGGAYAYLAGNLVGSGIRVVAYRRIVRE